MPSEIYAIKISNEVWIGTAVSLKNAKYLTKNNVRVELRPGVQQLRYPVWISTLVVIDEGDKWCTRCRDPVVPRVRDPGTRLVGIDDLPTCPACDMMHDLASRFLWTIIDNNQFVGERVEARLLEATIDAPTKRRRPTKSRYYNTHVHCGLTSIAAMAYTCLVIVGIAIACSTVVGALHLSNFKRKKAGTTLTADFNIRAGFQLGATKSD